MHFLRYFLFLVLVVFPSIASSAPSVSVSLSRETGVAPFDADDTPGNDSSATNNIIRTNDVISYKFEVVVLDDDATNIVLRLSTSPGLELDLPAFCRETGVSPVSSLSGSKAAGYSIVCNVGDIGEGSQVLYALPATVVPEQPNGSTVSMLSASIESDQTARQSFAGITDTVSGTPRLDLIKNDHTRPIGRRAGPNGEDGVVYLFTIEVATLNSGRGSELVDGTISFTDDIGNISPNALLYEGWPGAFDDACVANRANSTQRLWGNPYGNTRTADGGPGGDGSGVLERSVWNSGTIDCSPTAPGGTTTVTISGADLSGNHFPRKSENGGSLPANIRYLVSGNMSVWIPLSDIQAAGGELRVENVYSELNAVSISGQQNIEPDIANNKKTFVARDGGSGRSFYNHRDHNSYSYLQGQTSRRSGDGYILPGQIFATRHYQNNDAWLSKSRLENISYCTTFDNTTQRITEISGGHGAKVTFDGTPEGERAPFTIEYGTGAFGTAATCDNDDSPTGWSSDIHSVPGGPAAITQVRATAAYLAAPGGNSTTHRANLVTRYTALDNPVGTIVAEWGAYKNDQQNNGNWMLSSYDETTGLGNYGDRLFLTKAAVRIDKDSDPAGKKQVLAGDPLSFLLQPSATTPGSPPELTTDVTVTDTLPQAYDYVLGSASPPPANFTKNPDGTTTLLWEFPDTVINQSMAPITYDVVVTPTTPDQTSAVNRAVISSPNDGSPENVRSDTHSILVLNPSGFSIAKSPVGTLVAPGSDFGYTLTYANTGTSDFPGIQFIDILPNRRVPQSPPTAHEGVSYFVSASGTAGETFEYTRTDPTTIDEDPTAPSNQPGGSTVWCSSFSGGACPANAGQVMAVRGTSPAFLQGQPPRLVTITMQGDGNGAYNAYSNRFVARADGLAFSVASPTATVYVRTSDVSLTKTVSGPNAVNPRQVAFTLTASNAGPHTATGTRITDALPSGYVYAGHSGAGDYDPTTGIWTLDSITVGGSRSLVVRAEVVTGGDYLNVAEVTSQEFADPDSNPGNGVPNEDDIASAAVTRLSGRVFLDNGIGGGTAHDGVPNGGETGGQYGTIVLRDAATGTAQVIANVAADGTWSAILSTGLPGEFDAEFTPLPGYLLMSEGGAGLPSLVNPDPRDGQFRFRPGLAAEHTGLDFGLISAPMLIQDKISAIAPGQIVTIPHRYTATSAGTVVFALADPVSSAAGGFSSAAFADANCDGVPEATAQTAAPVVAGQVICVVIRTQASSGIAAGATHSYALLARTFFTNTDVTHTARNDDRLNVAGGSDQLVLRKLVRNVTVGTPELTTNTGDLGDVLEYRLVLTNPAAGSVNNVTVSDTTPAWTTLSAPITGSTTVAPGMVCSLATPSGGANAVGYAGALRWNCPGAFPPGGEGSLTFRVVIAP